MVKYSKSYDRTDLTLVLKNVDLVGKFCVKKKRFILLIKALHSSSMMYNQQPSSLYKCVMTFSLNITLMN